MRAVEPSRAASGGAPAKSDAVAAQLAAAAPPALDASALTVEPGVAAPLGASPGPAGGPKGVNFALWAPAATSVTLCLSDWHDAPLLEAPMQRTGDTWHAFVAGLPQVRGTAWAGHERLRACTAMPAWKAGSRRSGDERRAQPPAATYNRRRRTTSPTSNPCMGTHLLSPLQSKVLYGFKVDGRGGWDTPYRWDKNKARRGRWWCRG